MNQAEAMEYAESASKAILEAVGRLFGFAFGGDHKLVVISVKKDRDGNDAFMVVSDYDSKDEMVRIMNEAARKSVDGSMIDGDDFKEPKH